MEPSTLIAALTVVGGLATIILVALRFQRDSATQSITQQGQVVSTMRELVDELQEALDRCRAERKRLEDEMADLIARESQLKTELKEARKRQRRG